MDTYIAFASILLNCQIFYLSCTFVLVNHWNLAFFRDFFVQRLHSQMSLTQGHPFKREQI